MKRSNYYEDASSEKLVYLKHDKYFDCLSQQRGSEIWVLFEFQLRLVSIDYLRNIARIPKSRSIGRNKKSLRRILSDDNPLDSKSIMYFIPIIIKNVK